MGTRARGWLGAVLAVLATSGPLGAQTNWVPRVQWENDGFNFWVHPAHRPDEEYTNGLRLTLDAASAPWWGARFGRHRPGCDEGRAGPCLTTTVTVSHDMFTPNLDRLPYTVPSWEQERPFFSVLAVRGAGHVVTARSRRTTELLLGVTGPPAGGEILHLTSHRINRRFARAVSGWDTQIGFEPAVGVAWRYSMLALRLGGRRHALLDVIPTVGASLGNVRTAAELGGLVRVGLNLTHPWDPRLWAGRRPIEVWVTAGGKLEYVARDMSLDGNLFSPNRHVERVPGVEQYEFGLGARLGSLTLGYRAVTRSREYRTGPANHTWSSLSLGMSVVPSP
ncbi:MAG TPA: lipid A deacylase LpxR family protein [Gemmatimonadaceae bacterium]